MNDDERNQIEENENQMIEEKAKNEGKKAAKKATNVIIQTIKKTIRKLILALGVKGCLIIVAILLAIAFVTAILWVFNIESFKDTSETIENAMQELFDSDDFTALLDGIVEEDGKYYYKFNEENVTKLEDYLKENLEDGYSAFGVSSEEEFNDLIETFIASELATQLPNLNGTNFTSSFSSSGGSDEVTVESESGRGYEEVVIVGDKTYRHYKQGSSDFTNWTGGWNGSNTCGPTSTAIILSAFGYGDEYPPDTVATAKIRNNGDRANTELLSQLGISYQATSEYDAIKNHLQSGYPVMVLMGPGQWTSQGHYIVLVAINDSDEVFVISSAHSITGEWYSLTNILGESKVDGTWGENALLIGGDGDSFNDVSSGNSSLVQAARDVKIENSSKALNSREMVRQALIKAGYIEEDDDIKITLSETDLDAIAESKEWTKIEYIEDLLPGDIFLYAGKNIFIVDTITDLGVIKGYTGNTEGEEITDDNLEPVTIDADTFSSAYRVSGSNNKNNYKDGKFQGNVTVKRAVGSKEVSSEELTTSSTIMWWPIGSKEPEEDGKYSGEPVNSIVVSKFGDEVEFSEGIQGTNEGIDIQIVSESQASIIAVSDGTVINIGNDEFYGNYVEIEHISERKTVYSGLADVVVNIGDSVEQGQQIGIVSEDEDGKAKLHFEVIVNDEKVNPVSYVSNSSDRARIKAESSSDTDSSDEDSVHLDNSNVSQTSSSISSLDGFLMIGDSLTVGMTTTNRLQNAYVRAESGWSPQRWMLTENKGKLTDVSNPKGIIILLGSNSASDINTAKQGISSMQSMISMLQEKYVNTPIYVLKIPPIAHKINSSYKITMEAISYYNQQLETLGVNCLDVWNDYVGSDGYLKSGVSADNDGLHMIDYNNAIDAIIDGINGVGSVASGSALTSSGKITKVEGTGRTLKYIPKDEFDELIMSGSDEISSKFTLNDDYEIIVATWSKENGAYVIPSQAEDNYKTISYKDKIRKYIMPLELPLSFLIDTEDASFARGIASLGMNSMITITVQDNITTSYTKIQTYVVTQSYTSYESTEGDATYGGIQLNSTSTSGIVDGSITSKETNSINVEITGADSWCAHFESTYTMTETDSGYSSPTDVTISTSNQSISDNEYNVYITHQLTSTRTVTKRFSSSGDSVVTGNEKKFIKIMNLHSSAQDLVLGDYWILDYLEECSATKDIVDLVEYLLNATKDQDKLDEYISQTAFDFGDYNIKGFKSTSLSSGDILKEFMRSYENSVLWKYLNGEQSYNSTVGKYITEDKKYYICTGDSTDNGSWNFSFGIMHRVISEGKVVYNNQNYYSKYGIDITQYGLGTQLDVEIVDAVEDEILAERRTYVVNYLENEGITLNDCQIDALIDISYQYGNIKGFADAYRKYGDTEDLRNNWRFTKYGSRGEARWKLFHEGIYTASDGSILDPNDYSYSGGDFLEIAKQVWMEVCTSGKFSEYGSSSIPCQGPSIDCSAYVSWVLYEYGYTDFGGGQTSSQVFYNTNYNTKYGWEEINVASGENPIDMLQPGDIFVRYGGETHHVTLVAKIENGRLYSYDCGSTAWYGTDGSPLDETYFLTASGAGKIIRVKSAN